jgi:hypothetical protein
MKKRIDLIATKTLPTKAFIAFETSSQDRCNCFFLPFMLQEKIKKDSGQSRQALGLSILNDMVP